MTRQLVLTFLTAFVVMMSFVQISAAQEIDPHQLYEQRCGGCHEEHAGDFVRENLVRQGDNVVGVSRGKEIRSFLQNGHGKLSPAEVDVMVTQLKAILEAGAVFIDQCKICHGRAKDLVREKLTHVNGDVVGRYTGRDIRTFLKNHGRVTDGQQKTIVNMFERQLAVVPSNSGE